MLRVIRQLLSSEDVATVKRAAETGTFVDGMRTAGFLVADRKKNEELSFKQTGRDEVVALITERMWANKQLQVICRPRRILPPIMSRYKPGMRYGDHMDNVIMGGDDPFRLDCSITIFLNDPASYDGGELVISTAPGEQRVKLNAGDAVTYPTHYMHRVEEVTRGERLACITWIESLVRDVSRREILFDLAVAAEHVHKLEPNGSAFMTLEKARFNLLRMWADT